MIGSALLSMLVTQAAVVAAFLAVPVVAPQLALSVGISAQTVGYFTSFVFIGAVFAAQFAPRLIARFGPVRASQLTCMFAAAGVLLAALGSLPALVLSAILIGLAYAPGNPASSVLLARVTPPERRGIVFSVKQTAVPIGAACAGLLIPLVAGLSDWRVALLSAGAVATVVAIAVEPWRSRLDTIAPLTGARGEQPMRTVMADPALRRLAILAGGFAGIQFSTSAILVTFLVDSAGLALTLAGAVLTAAMVLSVGARMVLGFAADRFGAHRVLTAIAAVMTFAIVGCIACALAGDGAPVWATVAAAGVLATCAFSWNGVFLASVASAAAPGSIGGATAGSMTCVFAGGVLGPAAFSFASQLAGTYVAGFAVQLALAGVALAALAPGRRRKAEPA
ncbi:MAG: MFS transporter [Pseudomonadota bacterium]